eukprot:CAMPEP_0182424812 /NCGR_PEP_ID=MMETSP1167-20130531/11073_1 /TAXON_ID=2988 /ORGANISM="Mallomonas Sp, Strain CCMP3275" /LENGTH=211 /DNA_ID=CAMNT_0024604907 /DNA_START=93 /DNA_END=725 /DNA_ORIENTATION=+
MKLQNIEIELESVIDDPHLLERYNLLNQQYDLEKKELEQMALEFESIDVRVRERARGWLDQVKNLTHRLNDAFSQYMREMQYRGEVVLKEVGTFKEYEMQMRVSFHSDSQMSDLSGLRHSGGERAVSTIMYLMALQSYTSSPFRVVDEINQGMDERNERLAFDRIISSCCDRQKPQYFLVSPKLLQGLKSMDNKLVTALIVYNGPGVLDRW